MSANSELAAIFAEMADILALQGANSFRVSAHARVSRALKDLTSDVAAMVESGADLTEIEGIGDSSARKIITYLETGSMPDHEKLRAAVPTGLIKLLGVPGLGPKTVKMLWEQADVVDVESLRQQMDAGVIEDLPRMGKKTVQNIRDALVFLEHAGERMRIGQALPIAEAMVELLRRQPGVRDVTYAGSLRRGRETIGDIDLLVATTDPTAVSEAFRSMGGVQKVLAAGDTKSSVRLDVGVQVDLRVVDADVFGAALLYFSGSKQHNVRLRERAIKRGFRLNEYGLFPDDGDHEEPPQRRGVAPAAAKTEADIYRTLELPWIPPELREDRGELSTEPPDLITLEDIRAELHAHTIASDGKMTIDELAAAAMARGFHTIAVTDHSKSSAQAGGLSVDDLRAHIDAVHEVNERTPGITILAGSEVDILSDGRLDYDDDILAALDVVVASPHVALKQDRGKATARLVAAASNPLVDVIGHPTGRLINSREGLEIDIETLVEAAAANQTALEINANFMRLDLRDIHVRAAMQGGALIAINTDAHSENQFDYLRYGVLTGRRGWLTADRCVNAWDAERLDAWRRRARG